MISSSPPTAKVVFTPSGKRGDIPIGKTVLEAAQQLGVDLDTVCGGRGICDRCQIDLAIGEFSKHKIHSTKDGLSPFTQSEKQYFGANSTPTRRLGCQARIQQNIVVDIPPESQAHKQVVRKRIDVDNIVLNPSIKLYYVEVTEPSMSEPSGDLQRLLDAIEFDWGLTELSVDSHLLPAMQSILRKGGWKVTVALHNSKDIIAMWPGINKNVFGASVDIGSTTIAAHLCDLSTGEMIASNGQLNPQIRFGEDLMSRVSYAMLNPGGEQAMTQAVQEALQQLLTSLAAEAKITASDILDITIVGNPVMHHLLLGINPVELGGAPFALATDSAVCLKASDINIRLGLGARVYILPCIAGHVGADAAAAILSESPHRKEEVTLLVDVGTNAEIVLGNKNRLLAASSPTGPAFEGAQISHGQRAAPGAIERVRIDPKTLEPSFQVIGSTLWSTDPLFAKSIESSGITGICGSGIIEVMAEMFLSEILSSDGTIKSEKALQSPRVFSDGKTWSYRLYQDNSLDIVVSQNDVRAIQLAKAALYAGARLLMDQLNVESVDRVLLAGAFGSHIDVKYAMVLGLLPDCVLNKVSSVGNAAGKGATIALLDTNARAEIEDTVRKIHKIETAIEPKFQEHFIAALAIPHKYDAYSLLQQSVQLPERRPEETARRKRRSRSVKS